MAAPTLNRTRPFGSITGDNLGRCFEQDDLFFMADGSLWEAPAPPPDALPGPVPAAAEEELPAARPAPKKGKA